MATKKDSGQKVLQYSEIFYLLKWEQESNKK